MHLTITATASLATARTKLHIPNKHANTPHIRIHRHTDLLLSERLVLLGGTRPVRL